MDKHAFRSATIFAGLVASAAAGLVTAQTRAGMPAVEQRRDAGTDARGRATQGAVAE